MQLRNKGGYDWRLLQGLMVQVSEAEILIGMCRANHRKLSK